MCVALKLLPLIRTKALLEMRCLVYPENPLSFLPSIELSTCTQLDVCSSLGKEVFFIYYTK